MTASSTAIAPDGHSVAIARTREDLDGALRVRHQVFVEEIGALHATARGDGREETEVDAHATHFVARVDGAIVGTVRVQPETRALVGPARPLFGMAGEEHYDYSPFRDREIGVVEIARSSVLPSYRRPSVIADLWKAVILHCERRGLDHLVSIVQVGYTDSVSDAMIVHSRLARQALLHPTLALPARSAASGPEPPAYPLFSPSERLAPDAARIPGAFRLFHRFGLRTCSAPVFMPEIGRVGIAMVASPETYPTTTRRFLAEPAPWIQIGDA